MIRGQGQWLVPVPCPRPSSQTHQNHNLAEHESIMNTIPPEAQAELDKVVPKDSAQKKPEASTRATTERRTVQQPVIDVPASSAAPRWWNPLRLLKASAIGMLSAAVIGLLFIVAGLSGYIGGVTVGHSKAMGLAGATTPVRFEFESGSVEGAGFIRNFLWRNASKKFQVSSSVTTNHLTGEKSLEDTKIMAERSNGYKYMLKPGSKDSWVLLEDDEKRQDDRK